MKQIFGILLATSPFIVISILIIKEDGWQGFFKVWGMVIAMVTVITIGVYLLIE